jgi:glutathione S-transferase
MQQIATQRKKGLLMSTNLVLVSHHLCPYVQRAAISLTEKAVPFGRITIDFANRPNWFNKASPTGKVPLLMAGDRVLFESNVILAYLEETQPHPLLPEDALDRAEHRAWIEFGSSILNSIGGFYSAPDVKVFEKQRSELAAKFARVEQQLGDGPWFAGTRFGLVDAVYGPIFRYFDTFDMIGDFVILDDKPKVAAWRQELAQRPSVRGAVAADYSDHLAAFLWRRNSYLSSLMAPAGQKSAA